VHRHRRTRCLSVAAGDRVPDGAVLVHQQLKVVGVGRVRTGGQLRTVQHDRARADGVEKAGEEGVAGRVGDGRVEGEVRLDKAFRVADDA